jgi:hypothetical protein
MYITVVREYEGTNGAKIAMVDSHPEKKNDDDIEYIRKDALLEWAKEEEEKYQKRLECSNDDYDCGRADSYIEVIEKIESM